MRSYVFDFAPDRALKVLSEVHALSKRGKSVDGDGKAALGEFLNFCPVISVSGTQMLEYDVPKMMRQIKKITVDKAIKSGFDDESIYNEGVGIVMNESDVALFNKLASLIHGQPKSKLPSKVTINRQGLTDEEHQAAEKVKNKPKRQRTKEEEELLKKEKEVKKEQEKVIRLLRAVSIRLPMLIYGADVDIDDDIRMADFVDLVDNESWMEFMPQNVTKDIFRQLLKYYDEDVVIGAGMRIRRLAKAADELPPTRRVQRVAEIFALFRNPDKETVLTPWRVVNMHMGDTVGGYNFYGPTYGMDEILEEPRLIDNGDVTADIFLEQNARILEMNSKSGLYPLYLAYSLYAMKLPQKESEMALEDTQRLWKETLENNIFVLCKTTMARCITRRTLAGYQNWTVHAIHLSRLLDRMDDMPRLARKLTNPNTWEKEGERLKFDAVVGNPPYQSDTGGGSSANVAARQATPVFNLFVEQAMALQPRYISMITPARWYAGGIGLNSFRENMLNNEHITRLVDFFNSKDCFSTVDIAGGICYFLWERDKTGLCEVTNHFGKDVLSAERKLNEFDDIFVRLNRAISVIHKVASTTDKFLTDSVYPIDAFGFQSSARGTNDPFDGSISLIHSKGIGYVKREDVSKNPDIIDKFKVTIGILVPSNGEVGIDPEKGYKGITMPRILQPGEVTTFSYLVLGAFDSEQEALNFKDYMTGKFARFMLRQTYSSMHISKANFRFVPALDFTRAWSDSELYSKYGLSPEEINFIEGIIRPMD